MEFCILCYRSKKTGRSEHYCAAHQPKTARYNDDRKKLKLLCGDQYEDGVGREGKLAVLSMKLDSLSTPADELLKTCKRTRRNGILLFDSAFALIKTHYKKASNKLEPNTINEMNPENILFSYLINLKYEHEECGKAIFGLKDSELFDLLVRVAARYQAYSEMIDRFPDGRKRNKKKKILLPEKEKYLAIIEKLPLKPNGRVSRVQLGIAIDESRHKAGRIINELKLNGDIKGNI